MSPTYFLDDVFVFVEDVLWEVDVVDFQVVEEVNVVGFRVVEEVVQVVDVVVLLLPLEVVEVFVDDVVEIVVVGVVFEVLEDPVGVPDPVDRIHSFWALIMFESKLTCAVNAYNPPLFDAPVFAVIEA